MTSVRLVDLPLPVLHALVARDSDSAATLLGLPVPQAFADETPIWQFMINRLAADPDSAGWTASAVVVDETIVGNAGFKGAPDADGTAEIGYKILPEHRRRGHAASAVRLLLDRADRDPSVRLLLAKIDPGNVASIAVVTRTGFSPDGDEIHERWGRQLRFAYVPSPEKA